MLGMWKISCLRANPWPKRVLAGTGVWTGGRKERDVGFDVEPPRARRRKAEIEKGLEGEN